jgi:hypothetical protein
MPNRLQQPAIATLLAASLLSSPAAAAPLHVLLVSPSRPIVLVQHGAGGFGGGYGGEHGLYGGNGHGGWGGRTDHYFDNYGSRPAYRPCYWHWGDGRTDCGGPPQKSCGWGSYRNGRGDCVRWPRWPFVQTPQSTRPAPHGSPSNGNNSVLLLVAAGVGGAGLLALRHHAQHQRKHAAPTVRVMLRAGTGRLRLIRRAPPGRHAFG